MADINSIVVQARSLREGIDRLLRSSTYREFCDLSGLEINYRDSEQLFLLNELQSIMEKLDDVEDAIRYIAKPVREMGKLRKNASGRYELYSGHEYHCGSVIEALVSDERYDVPYWARTCVERDGVDYYLVGYREVPMQGLTVRVRETT